MKMIMSLSTLLIAGLMTFSSFASTVSPNGNWSAYRSNTGGTTAFAMRPHSSNFCFLTRVSVEETDTGNESATCRVVRLGSDWWLQATLGRSSDADVRCSASCYSRW